MQLTLARVLVATALLLSAAQTYAYRVEFIARVGGERITNAEVCLHRGTDGHGPVATLLATDEVRCLPADEIIDVPAGVWSFYVVAGDSYVSSHGSTLVRRGPRLPDEGYRAIGVELTPAASITFARFEQQEGDRFAAYVPMLESSVHGPAAFPLPRGQNRIVVPAQRTFTLLRIRDGVPIAAGPMTRLEEGETIDAIEVAAEPDERDLIGWIALDPASIEEAGHASAPAVRLIEASGKEHAPLFDWDSAGAADEGLVIFDGVPAGAARIRVDGEGWRTTETHVTPTTPFVRSPIVARLAQRLSVNWSIPSALLSPAPRCDEARLPSESPEWLVELFRCPSASAATREGFVAGCERLSVATIGEKASGVAVFDVRAPGTYLAALRSSGTTIGVMPVQVARGEDSEVTLSPFLPSVYGRVSEGDRPMRAVIRFETGTAISDESGAYFATLTADPLDNGIEIRPCDGSDIFYHLPAERLMGTRNYDIRIPSNRIEVTVRDARSGKGVPGAAIGRGIFPTRDEALEATTARDLQADEYGRAVVTRLQPGSFARLCALAEGYWPPVCADPIAIGPESIDTVELTLEPRTILRGRITTASPLRGTMIYRTTSDGRIVEQSIVEPDGRFTFAADQPASTLIVAGLDFPLYVTAQPELDLAKVLEVTVPSGTARSFTVAFDESMPQRSGWFTLSVGGRTVPLNVMSAHLGRRGTMSYVDDGTPVVVSEVMQSAPIAVIAIVGSYPAPESASEVLSQARYAPIREMRALGPENLVVFSRNRSER